MHSAVAALHARRQLTMRPNPSAVRKAHDAQFRAGAQQSTGLQDEGRSSRPVADANGAGENPSITMVRLMDGLAFQAHLVALDAVVEAALAGGQEHSFQTVAAEALQLARRTVDVAEEIRGLLDDAQQKPA